MERSEREKCGKDRKKKYGKSSVCFSGTGFAIPGNGQRTGGEACRGARGVRRSGPGAGIFHFENVFRRLGRRIEADSEYAAGDFDLFGAIVSRAAVTRTVAGVCAGADCRRA